MSFGGSQSESQQQPYQYGEMPGIFEAGQEFSDIARQWLGQFASSNTPPGWGEAMKMFNQYAGVGKLAGSRLSEMLSPEWLSRRSPGLGRAMEGMTRTQRTSAADAERALRMEFGGMGQGWSSAKAGAIGRNRMESENTLAQMLGGMEMQDYWNRVRAQQGAAGQSYQTPLAASSNLSQASQAFLQQLLSYLLGGRGRITPLTSSSSESFDIGLPAPSS